MNERINEWKRVDGWKDTYMNEWKSTHSINRINERVRKPKKELKEERIRTKELEKEKILQSRKRVLKRLEGVDELLEDFESVNLSGLVKKRRN